MPLASRQIFLFCILIPYPQVFRWYRRLGYHSVRVAHDVVVIVRVQREELSRNVGIKTKVSYS